ncbi:hypothetical protein ABZ078_42765 [Streptomyces sp. NPDC006385]|uniref:hypothetical protein n=1 Tax=Streptomyces sp. NPDC006385 TaxID=3156761 RepID=UPI0033ADF8C0
MARSGKPQDVLTAPGDDPPHAKLGELSENAAKGVRELAEETVARGRQPAEAAVARGREVS